MFEVIMFLKLNMSMWNEHDVAMALKAHHEKGASNAREQQDAQVHGI
jgi:hypothetical protein